MHHGYANRRPFRQLGDTSRWPGRAAPWGPQGCSALSSLWVLPGAGASLPRLRLSPTIRYPQGPPLPPPAPNPVLGTEAETVKHRHSGTLGPYRRQVTTPSGGDGIKLSGRMVRVYGRWKRVLRRGNALCEVMGGEHRK